jgi:hypothetical protein
MLNFNSRDKERLAIPMPEERAALSRAASGTISALRPE